ncbi:hypothetical protein GCM10022254_30760 [Actinomadura meridiana]|uniref:DUF6879 domain-containing protein n=1 Tax=Actinomadura meridiana TaxID=559626 RepID=A0ABP8C1D4_9ACTN
MKLMTPEERDELLGTFKRDAFHLELKDSYGAAYEDAPLSRWLRGEPNDFTWLQPWLERVRHATRFGRTVRRVRVVSEPLTEYIRWEHSVTPLNQEAGEDIRWLSRWLLPEDIVLPFGGNDWWLFDDELVTVGHFDDEGRVKGSELITDPGLVADCGRVRDQLWTIAIPHDKYRPA